MADVLYVCALAPFSPPLCSEARENGPAELHRIDGCNCRAPTYQARMAMLFVAALVQLLQDLRTTAHPYCSLPGGKGVPCMVSGGQSVPALIADDAVNSGHATELLYAWRAPAVSTLRMLM